MSDSPLRPSSATTCWPTLHRYRAVGDPRLVFKGGTLLRLCYFADYRYSADLDFSAIDGLSSSDAVALVAVAVDTCRKRLEVPLLEIVDG